MSEKSMTLTQRRMSNFKYFVYACVALAAVVDLAVFITLAALGMPYKYWLIPLLLAAVDGLFLLVSVFTNFRFGYYLPYVVIYGVAVFALSLSSVIVGLDTGSGTAYTDLALSVWPLLHLLITLVVVFVTVFAGKNGKSAKVTGGVLSALLLAGVVMYGILVANSGYFGQGAEDKRVLRFALDADTDTYSVVGVEDGASGTVDIPLQFNGHAVTSVDCGVFAAEGVRYVALNCDKDVKLQNESALDGLDGELVIAAPKDNFDHFRKKLFDGGHTAAALCMEPTALGDGEVYVTYEYGKEYESISSGKYLPTWFGTAGDVLTIADAPVWYTRCDASSDEDLVYAYNNFNGYIFGGIMDGERDLNKAALSESVKNAEIRFDKVYRIIVSKDNDESYEISDSFRQTSAGGTAVPYRFTTAKNCHALLSSLPERKGFSIEWKYYNNGFLTTVTSFAEALDNAKSSTVTLYPVWSLNAPSVSKITLEGATVYGNAITLSSAVTAPAEGIDLRYSWKREGSEIAVSPSYSDACLDIDEGGEYELTVTALSEDGTVTSLTSQATAKYSITVKKRDLHFSWTVPDDPMYTGTARIVKAAYDSADVVAGDVINFGQSFDTVRDAGRYVLTVDLVGAELAQKYQVVGSREYTVTRAPLTVTAGDMNKTYDGKTYGGTFSYTSSGLVGSDTGKLGAAVYDCEATRVKDAGDYPIRVVSLASEDGILNNYETTYVPGTAHVGKKQISSVTWSSAALVYNGSAQSPEVTSVTGAVEGDDVVNMFVYSVGNGKVAAGNDYTCSATLVSKNYTLGGTENVSHTFDIAPKPITLVWDTLELVYTGTALHPVVSDVDGLISADSAGFESKLSYGSGAVNVGNNYPASATFTDGNYTVTAGGTATYKITPRHVTPVWTGGGSVVYNGEAHMPAVTGFNNVASKDRDGILSKVSYTGTNGTSLTHVGSTTVTVSLADDNYAVDTPTCVLEVTARPVSFVWSTGEYVYNGSTQGPAVSDVTNAVASDRSALLAAISVTGLGKNAGKHTASAVLTGMDDYTVNARSATEEYEIAKRKVALNWSDDGLMYLARVLLPEVSLQSGAVPGEEGLFTTASLTCTGSGVNAGPHTATAKLGASLSNYDVEESSKTFEYTIKPHRIEIVWSSQTTYTYDGNDKGVPAVAQLADEAHYMGGDILFVLAKVTYTGRAIEVGTHIMTASIDDPNFVIDPGTATREYEIV